jgi:Ca2+-binding RTX toxin-like protein
MIVGGAGIFFDLYHAQYYNPAQAITNLVERHLIEYKGMLDRGLWDRGDFLNAVYMNRGLGGEDMVAFYERYGLDQYSIDAIQVYIKKGHDMEKLIHALYLDTEDQAIRILARVGRTAAQTALKQSLQANELSAYEEAMMQSLDAITKNAIASGDENLIQELIEMSNNEAQAEEFAHELETLFIKGTDNADILEGTDADNATRGMLGDDFLIGNGGNDYYFYELGDGNDIIDNRAINSDTETDKLLLGDGITPENINLSREGDDLLFQLMEGSIRVKDWFANDESKLDEIVFKDGTIWNTNYIDALFPEEPGDPNEILWSQISEGKNEILGTDTAESLTGTTYDDAIRGDDGNDVLKGNGGNDSYFYRLGDGHDTIENNATNSVVENDKFFFGVDITPADVITLREDSDLLLQLEDGSVRVKDWFANENNKLDEIVFEDRTAWNTAYIDALYPDPEPKDPNEILWSQISTDKNQIVGTDGAETLVGTASDDAIRGCEGDDTFKHYRTIVTP